MRSAAVPRDRRRRPPSRAALPALGRRRRPGHVDVDGQQRGHYSVQKGPKAFQRHTLQQQQQPHVKVPKFFFFFLNRIYDLILWYTYSQYASLYSNMILNR